MDLKYLFTVGYRDGDEFHQGADDASLTREGGSAFTDVRLDDVAWFRLQGDGRQIGVDLSDGHFEVDGLQFWVNDDHNHFTPETKLRLIYFRRHRHDFTPDRVELAHDVTYYIGWQATIDGRNYRATIGVI